MRKSRQEAAETRQRIVRAAAAEFRRHGIVATGLSDLMTAAGLTHGGFYRHFASKDEVVAEACADAACTALATMASAVPGRPAPQGVAAVARQYLSAAHRDNPGGGCPLAALGSELARCDERTRAVATEAFLKFVEMIAARSGKRRPDVARKRALVAASMMVGALMVSRIVNDPELSAEILQQAEQHLAQT